MQERRVAAAETKEETQRTKGMQKGDTRDVALAPGEALEAPDAGGASGSHDILPHLLPNVQAERSWSQA
jgi:hypothetical protein